MKYAACNLFKTHTWTLSIEEYPVCVLQKLSSEHGSHFHFNQISCDELQETVKRPSTRSGLTGSLHRPRGWSQLIESHWRLQPLCSLLYVILAQLHSLGRCWLIQELTGEEQAEWTPSMPLWTSLVHAWVRLLNDAAVLGSPMIVWAQ